MTATLVLLFVVAVAFSAVAIAAFGWAARTGQFHGVEEGSRAIFGADEPVGRPTDRFPPPEGGRPLETSASR